MFQHILKQMRDKVRTRQYVMTLHAEEEMSDDELTIFDVERGMVYSRVIFLNGRKRPRQANGNI